MSSVGKKMMQAAAGAAGAETTLLLYVADRSGKTIREIDASNPSSMSVLRTVTDTTYLNDVSDIKADQANQVLYTCSGSRGELTSWDTSGATITRLDSINLDSTYATSRRSIALDVSNEIAFLVGDSSFFGIESDGDNMVSVDISNPSSLTLMDRHTITNAWQVGFSMGLALDLNRNAWFAQWQNLPSPGGGRFYTGTYNATTGVIANSGSLSTYEEPGTTVLDLSGATKYAYIAGPASPSTVRAINISTVASPSLVDNFSAIYARGIDIDASSDVLYLGDVFTTLYSIDTSTPASLSTLQALTDATNADNLSAIAVVDDVLYAVSSDDGSLNAFDVSNPSSMSFIAKLTGTSTAGSLAAMCPVSVADPPVVLPRTTNAYS